MRNRTTNTSKVLTILGWFSGLVLLWGTTSNIVHFAVNIVVTFFVTWGLYFILSKEPLREKVLRFILANTTICILLGFFELFAIIEIIDYRVVFSTPIFAPWRKPDNILDQELVYIHKPYQRISGVTQGGISWLFDVPDAGVYPYEIQYDRNGFRNPTDMENADIAVLGDSFIEGAKVGGSELMTSVLSNLQKKSVANLGLIGYGPKHMEVVLRRYALPLHPKVIIWPFFEGNDLKNVHDYNEITTHWTDYSNAYHSFMQRSFTKNSFSAVVRLFGEPKPSAQHRSGLVTTTSGHKKPIYFMYPGKKLSDHDLSALGQTGTVLENVYNLCLRNGIELVVVFIPSKFRVYHKIAKFEQNSDIGNWFINDLPVRFYEKISEISSEIGYLDLTEVLIQTAKAGIDPYFFDDSHWSPKGHRVVALALHDYLSKRAENL